MSPSSNSGPGYARAPEHTITIMPSAGKAVATFNGQVIAESVNALELRESKYNPVVYFPADDVRKDLAQASDRSTHCPFKGDASYWRFGTDDDIAWSYETPFDEVMEIAGHVAFYTDQVEVTAGA